MKTKTITENSVTVNENASLKIGAANIITTTDTINNGTLTLTAGNLGTNVKEADGKDGTTIIEGEVTNTGNKTITQNAMTINGASSLTTQANTLSIEDMITATGNLILTGTNTDTSGNFTAAVDGAGKVQIGDGTTPAIITATTSDQRNSAGRCPDCCQRS